MATSQADQRPNMRHDRHKASLDPHATCILAVFAAGRDSSKSVTLLGSRLRREPEGDGRFETFEKARVISANFKGHGRT